MKMAIEDMSIESIERYLARRKEEKQKEENYCVRDYKDIVVSGGNDLLFANGAEFFTWNDGVCINKNYVERVILVDGEDIKIQLKGTKHNVERDYEELLWSTE
jgi:hypothetical protein